MQIPLTVISFAINYLFLYSELSLSQSFVRDNSSTAMPILVFGNLVILLAQLVLVNGIAAAALTRAIGNSFLGEKVGILEAYRRVGKSLVSVVGAILLVSVLTIPLVLWMLVPCVGWLSGPGVLMFLWGMVFPLIAPAVVLERRGVRNSIGRAWNLAMRRFWWLVGFILILWLFSYIIVNGPVMLVNILFQSQVIDIAASGGMAQAARIQMVVQTLLSLVLGLLFYPLQSAGFILAYFDLRTRFEGFDLALLARQAEGGGAEVDELSALGLQPGQKIRIGANEIGYYIGLTLIVVAIFGGLMALLFGVSALFVLASGL